MKKIFSFFIISIFLLPLFAGSFIDNVKFNPECKIKNLPKGEILVTLKTENYKISGFDADLLKFFYKHQRSEIILNNLSQKYNLSEDECRQKIKHSISTLKAFNIINES